MEISYRMGAVMMRFYSILFLAAAVFLIWIPMAAGQNIKTVEEVPAISHHQEEDSLYAVINDWEQQAIETSSREKKEFPKLDRPKMRYFKILNRSTGKTDKISAEDFVRGAVCSEMPADFHPEALKAQAVSARTWALYQQMWQKEHPDPALKGADFSADPQNWKGYVTEKQAKERFGENFESWWKVICEAAESTEGQVLCWNEQPIAAAYHAISPGQTEDAQNVWGTAVPCLTSVSSRGDELAPGYEESRKISRSQMGELLGEAIPPEKADTWFYIEESSPAGSVLKIKAGKQTFSGQEFRKRLKLRSACFTVMYQDDSFIITTKGYGHGVGLSQYGADFMARQGSDYQHILEHYYKGAEIYLAG